jgi:hypothetical protein
VDMESKRAEFLNATRQTLDYYQNNSPVWTLGMRLQRARVKRRPVTYGW